MALRVLSWNMKHGRAVPGAGRELREEFAVALAGWPWDVALLQEVPPWWPAWLGERLDANARAVPTSRNALPALRRAIATRRPDLIKSNGGGANAILVRRSAGAIAEHRKLRLGWLPERRWLHAVALSSGVWIGNLHTEGEAEQGLRAAEAIRQWSAGAPALLGGDFNLRSLSLPGFAWAGGHGVDHLYLAGGLRAVGFSVPERGALSDHAPILAILGDFHR